MWVKKSDYETLVRRVVHLEKEIAMPISDKSSYISFAFRGETTSIGAIVDRMNKSGIFASNVKVFIRDEETEEYGSAPLDTVIDALVAHCGLKILPPKELKARVEKKKK